MDRYAGERERLAEQLTACFENLEQETGIFLIKPVYSFKGRYIAGRNDKHLCNNIALILYVEEIFESFQTLVPREKWSTC